MRTRGFCVHATKGAADAHATHVCAPWSQSSDKTAQRAAWKAGRSHALFTEEKKRKSKTIKTSARPAAAISAVFARVKCKYAARIDQNITVAQTSVCVAVFSFSLYAAVYRMALHASSVAPESYCCCVCGQSA